MPTKTRKPRLYQHIPDGPPAMFHIETGDPGRNYWEFILTDCMSGSSLFWGTGTDLGTERPVFRYDIPNKGCQHSVDALAAAAVQHMAEGRGLVHLTEMTDGLTSFAAIFAANGRQIFCIWSTDVKRAAPVLPTAGWQLAWRALRDQGDIVNVSD